MSKIYFNNRLYLTQYIQNAITSTCNLHKKSLMRYFTFIFFPCPKSSKFSAYLMLVAHSVCFQIFYS